MSNTTVVNSKAMQSLLAQAERQPGSRMQGTSFHQLLEGALSEKAKAETAPATLAKAAVGSEPALGGVATKLAKSTAAADKQLAARSTKTASQALAANDDALTGDAAAATPAQSSVKAAAAGPDTTHLDETQLKLVNAPALPETAAPETAAPATAATAHVGAPRGPVGAAARPSPPLSMQAGGASSLTGASAVAGPRGFGAALATAHLAGTLPASIVDQTSFDPSLHLSITPQAAQMSMDTGASGPLLAQLQITNGVADVRLTGDAASLLARHGAELSLGLTAAGLQPGRIDITAPTAGADLQSATSDGSRGGAFRNDAQARDGSEMQGRDQPSTPKLAEPVGSVSSTLVGRPSRLHVKA